MKYNYSDVDLIKFPQQYQLSSFEGREFISSYKEARQNVLNEIKKNIHLCTFPETLQTIQKSLEVKTQKNHDRFVTENMLVFILTKLDLKENEKENSLIEKLLKNFEITKKIYSEYNYELKKHSGNYEVVRNYILFSLICSKKFLVNNNLKFLNSLLKLNDTICSKINTISDPTDLLLIYYAINFELEYIKELIKKKL